MTYIAQPQVNSRPHLGIVSILLESVVGTPAMARYRAWRHGVARRPADERT